MNFKIYSRMKPISALTLGFFGLVTSVFAVSSEQTNGKLTLGDPIPEVTAQDQDGQTVNLAQAGKAGFTLIYFYPKAMSPGCTAQACSLRDSYTELQQKGVFKVESGINGLLPEAGPFHLFRFSLEQASLRAGKVTAFGVSRALRSFLATVSQPAKALGPLLGSQQVGWICILSDRGLE